MNGLDHLNVYLILKNLWFMQQHEMKHTLIMEYLNNISLLQIWS